MFKRILQLLSEKTIYLYVLRYLLFIWLTPYGVSKIIGLQFTLSPPSAWQEPLEQASGAHLTWVFLGYSRWFQVLLGLLELIPGILLLFRRTYLAGAIILFPVLLNVVLINFALNLWSATKVISLVMISFNLLILLLERKKIAAACLAIMQRSTRQRYLAVEVLINVALITGWSYFFLKDFIEYRAEQHVLLGNWTERKPAEWRLISETGRNGQQLPLRNKRIYFSPGGGYNEIEDIKSVDYMSYSLDKKDTTLTISTEHNEWLRSYKYDLSGDSVLTLRAIGFNDSVEVYTRRIINDRL